MIQSNQDPEVQSGRAVAKGALRRAGARLVDRLGLESFRPSAEHRHVGLSRLPGGYGGLRVAHLTDIHMASFLPDFYLERVVDLVAEQKPDLICLTGDFIHQFWDVRHIPRLTRHLERARPELGIYACPGNHDYRLGSLARIKSHLEDGGIRLLVNERHDIVHDGVEFQIVGAGEWIYKDTRVAHLLDARTEDHASVRLLLAHNPDAYEEIFKHDVDLVLSGHTHGGQLNLPMVGALNPMRGVGRPYMQGFYRVGRTYVNVNRGVGMVVLPFRMNCPPEVTLLDLRAA